MSVQKTRIFILTFFAIILCLQLPATLYVGDQLTFDFISIARIFQILLSVILIVTSLKSAKTNFLNLFLNISIIIQTLATIKYEPTNELVAYNFIGILILISSMTFRENLKKWVYFNFPVHLIALILPVFFKSKTLYANLNLFSSNFLFGIFSITSSLLIVAMFSAQRHYSSKLSQELDDQEKRLNLKFEELQKMKIQLEIGNIASQVAHDIRSPLSALENLVMTHLIDSQDGFVAIESIRRIKKIANALLEKNRAGFEQRVELYEINSLVKLVVASKGIEFPLRKISLDLSEKNPKVSILDIHFESILSNLINNAFEASTENSDLCIKTDVSGLFTTLSVTDTGIGILPEQKSKLGSEKISFNKKDGNGLGLYLANKTIKDWGGTLNIDSTYSKGTVVTIKLPLIDIINSNETYVLIDDDELVRITWKSRAEKAGISLLIYSNSMELFADESKLSPNFIFYIDSELISEKGEDVAKSLFYKGYKNLHMTTGHSLENFSHLGFIKNTIGKASPF